MARNSDLVGNWDINDYLKLSSITGYHTNVTIQAADGVAQPPIGLNGAPIGPYSAFPYTFAQKFNDFSQELRLSSDPEQRFSWTAGANYISNTTYTEAITDFLNPAGTRAFISNQSLGAQKNQTVGIFGGAYFKITPELTLSGEAREQSDRRVTTAQLRDASVEGNLTPNVTALSKTYRSFSPRVALDYDLGGRKKIYTSYATGTRPGGFNANILAQASNPLALAQIAAALGNGGVFYDEEKLKIAEVGIKGEFDGGKGFFDVNGYMGKLENQQITISALIPAIGNSVTATSNAGESKIHGIEFQGNYQFTPEFSLGTTFAWNHTKRNKFQANSALAAYGTIDLSGKKFAFVPELSGSIVAGYQHPLQAWDGWKLFSNVSAIYRGKQYADIYNASYLKARYQADVHVGVSNQIYSIEGYVKNVFNDHSYTGGQLAPDFGTGSQNLAFSGGWNPPRQVGARLHVKF